MYGVLIIIIILSLASEFCNWFVFPVVQEIDTYSEHVVHLNNQLAEAQKAAREEGQPY